MKTDFDTASYKVVDVRQNPQYLAGVLDKGEIVLNHIKAMANLYDPGVKLPYNQKLIADYGEELYQALWPEPSHANKPPAPRNIFS